MSRSLFGRSFGQLCVLLSLAGGVACGDDGAGGAGASGGAGGTNTGGSATGGSGGTGTGGEIECDPPNGTPSAALPTAFTSLMATVNDTAGAPVNQAPVFVCGKDICTDPTSTSAAGTAIINYSGADLDRPIFKAGDGLTYTKIGYDLFAAAGNQTAVLQALTDSKKPLTAGATVTVGDLTLVMAADGVAAFDPFEFGEPADQTLRAAAIPAANLDAMAPGQTFAMMYGIGPVETILCPPAKVTVKNAGGLAANAAVDFFVYEFLIEENFGTYGKWTKVSGGTVSADGMTISTNDAEGLPLLGTIGIKAAN